MARFRVELVQSIVETAIVFVEATNEQQAEELALELAWTASRLMPSGVSKTCSATSKYLAFNK